MIIVVSSQTCFQSAVMGQQHPLDLRSNLRAQEPARPNEGERLTSPLDEDTPKSGARYSFGENSTERLAFKKHLKPTCVVELLPHKSATTCFADTAKTLKVLPSQSTVWIFQGSLPSTTVARKNQRLASRILFCGRLRPGSRGHPDLCGRLPIGRLRLLPPPPRPKGEYEQAAAATARLGRSKSASTQVRCVPEEQKALNLVGAWWEY